MIVGIPSEIHPQEQRVVLTPGSLTPLIKAGDEFRVQNRPGLAATFTNSVDE